MKLKVSVVVIIGIILVLSLVGCIRPTIDEAMATIPAQDAPYVITFYNDGWVEGAILAQSYKITSCYLVASGYYDRHGFHQENKYIPLRWLIDVEQR